MRDGIGTRDGGDPTGPSPWLAMRRGPGSPASSTRARAPPTSAMARSHTICEAGLHAGRGQDGQVGLAQVPEHLGALALGGGDGLGLPHA